MQKPPEVRLKLLGAVELRSAGATISLGGPKVEALIARLALAPGQDGWCSANSLISSMWSQDSDVDRTALHPHVSRLRRELRRYSLDVERSADRYRLTPSPPSDLGYMTSALARATELTSERPLSTAGGEEAIAVLDEGLGHWETPVLGRLEALPAFAADAARIGELHTQMLELRALANSSLSRWSQAIDDLQTVVDDNPYREQTCAELAVVLYRAGRQRDALACIEQAKLRLLEDLGVDAGPALRETELAILQQDPRLDPPRTAVRRSPPTEQSVPEAVVASVKRRIWDSLPPLPVVPRSNRLIGRSAATQFAREIIQKRAVGVICGPSGIGKSTVLAQLNAPTARGLRYDDTPALWPWRELLTQLAARSNSNSTITTALRLVGDDMEAGSFRQSLAVRDALRASGADAIVIDDAQFFDTTAMQLLEFIATQRSDADPAVLVGWRLEPTRVVPQIGAVHDLTLLNRDDITSLIVRELGSRPPARMVAEVESRSGGLPLLVDRCLMRLRQGASLAGIDVAHDLTLPGSLSAQTLEVLALAAIHGGSAPVGLLAECLNLETTDILAVTDISNLSGLVSSDGHHLEYGHDAWRLAAERSVTAAERARLHRLLFQHLRSQPSPNPRAVARHLWGCGPLKSDDEAAATMAEAGKAAHAAGAYDEATMWWSRALDVAQDQDLRSELHQMLGDVDFRAGRVAESRSHFRAAMNDGGDPIEQAELAAAMAGFGLVFVDLDDDELSIVKAGASLDDPSPRAVAAQIKCQSRVLIAEWRQETLVEDSKALTARAEAESDAETFRWTLGVRLVASMTAAGARERLSVARQMTESATADGDDRALALGLVHQADCLAEFGRFEETEHMIDQLETLGAASGRVAVKWYATHYRAGLELARGNTELGNQLLGESLLLMQGAHGPAALEAYGGVLIASHSSLDRMAELELLVEGGIEASASRQSMDVWSMVRADVFAAAGRLDKARDHLSAALASAQSLPSSSFRTIELAQLAGLGWTLSDPTSARLAVEHLSQYADRCCAAPGMVLAGSAHVHLGLAKAALGEPDAAESIERGIEQNSAWGLHAWERRGLQALELVRTTPRLGT
ncbi:MAG: BTAD domain-containing putative transcriptional regulator [Acidimicrobiales bacterium]|nr:AfsR/SARP family transcriptional regulator [Acidimicrobiales bacterium]